MDRPEIQVGGTLRPDVAYAGRSEDQELLTSRPGNM